jgi:hypothetical protein
LTETWGESLFAADNGVAYGMAPIDSEKAASVPGLQAKQLFMPVAQLTASTQLDDGVSFEGFYHFEWRPANIPSAGSYFGSSDIVPVGGERLLFTPAGTFGPFSPSTGLFRGKDSHPTGGSFGLSAHYSPPNSDFDFGIYALQYNDNEPYLRTNVGAAIGSVCGPATQFSPLYGFGGVPFCVFNPSVVSLPNGKLGTYSWGYQKHIQLYGVSTSTTYGPVNLAAEVSARVNNDLQSIANPPAIGNSLHYQTSFVYVGDGTPLYQGVTWLGELFGSHVMQVTSNAASLDTSRERTTLGLRTQFDPAYYQVMPGLDVDVPITLGYNFMGNSMTTNIFNNTGLNHGADLTIGVHGVYHNVWQASLSLTQYFGHQDDGTNTSGGAPGVTDDRDFVIASIQRSF